MSMTLDGYVAGPNGEKDWAMRTGHPDGKAWVGETLSQAGAHLVGRRLYTDWAGYWPTSTDPLAASMNSIPKIVFSRSGKLEPDTPTAPGWDNPRVLGTDLAADIETLKAEPGKDLLAQGGVSFARSLIQLNLIDEYRLVVHPSSSAQASPCSKTPTPSISRSSTPRPSPAGRRRLCTNPSDAASVVVATADVAPNPYRRKGQLSRAYIP
jgi:dihydrofolate reductase